ncbi:MAG TPA: ATP-dependent DNA helicase RecG [Limnochordia bacterium]|nr:ATP-dependent DNA helicase RecG [Limnochordia bacterium]
MRGQRMLDQPVTVLPGVGEKKAQALKGLGLRTVRDVLFSFPRSYKDFQKVLEPHQVEVGAIQLVRGPLLQLHERPISQGRRLIQASLGGQLGLTWFVHHRAPGPSFLYRKLQRVKEVWVYGQVKEGGLFPEMISPEVYTRQPEHQGLMPIYPLAAGITNNQRVSWVKFALKYLAEIEECLPATWRARYLDRREALRQIHFPTDWAHYERARERLVFEEFFLFHLGLQRGQRYRAGVAHKPDGDLVGRFLAHLPFELTKDQQAALQQVAKDMEAPLAMRRLIQGEVGSGKTIVAEYGAVKAVASGGQVAMMVPTEVLAVQMAERLKASLEPLGINVALLVGNMKPKEQEAVRAALAQGEVDVVVGTHALITDKVEYHNLTLAIVDEQHRFGVRQRAALLGKGNPDLLVMSATPIPRSLALTMYGDLDITEIRQLPANRQPVDTRLIHPAKRADVYRYVLSRIKQGEQAYVVFPLVEESEHVDLKAAVQEMEALRRGLLAGARVGLIHGQMGKEKEEVFQAFARGELDVLIATTVVEVGMNVPNATVMVIENAERFGLAQLHQLRGRVGRGNKPGICFLLAYNHSAQSRARLEVVRRSNDGFFIAEEDLRLRGPGDLLGVRQWGQPYFRLADLQQDRELLQLAAEAARELLSRDPQLKGYPELAAELDNYPV